MRDPSGLSYTAIAQRLELSPDAIYMMKGKQRDRFDYIYTLDPYFEKGYRKYIEQQEDSILIIRDIYYDLEERQELSRFSEYLYELGIYSNPMSWVNGARIYLFAPLGRPYRHDGLLRRLKVIDAYETYQSKG